MKHGSLFSGIGGFDLASQWMGWKNVFHCENNPFGKRVLQYYWPNAISYDDIRTTDFTIHRGKIDILTGGFPCQPFSLAGKRKGTEDDRHLWPEMLRAIREIGPDWVVGENVFGITNWSGGLVFEQVQADLEAEGYEVQPFILPACSVNAPHRRDRVWFVAHRRCEFVGTRSEEKSKWSHDNDKRCGICKIKGSERDCNKGRTAPDAGLSGSPVGQLDTMWADELCKERDAADAHVNIRCKRRVYSSRSVTAKRYARPCNTRSYRGNTWDNFPTQPPVRGRNDGFSPELVGITVSKHRNESIKAYGNAIVPQVALQIFRAIQEYEQKKGDTI